MLAGISAYNSSSSDEEEQEKPVVKQKKKILVPRVTNSSDEDDKPPVKKMSLGAERKSSGLFSKLPPPRNVIGDGKQVNRTLIPHVFSKKPETKSTKKVETKEEDLSDDDGEVEFFSFVDKKSKDYEQTENLAEIKVVETESSSSTGAGYGQAGPVMSASNPAPPVQEEFLHPSSSRSDPVVAPPQLEPSAAGHSNSWQNNEQFLRLQGKKNRNEKVEFIDVHADSALKGNKELLLKQISEEKNTYRMSHSKKNDKIPSAQSKRKHQLSYLIHQAKEREVELKNAWAVGHAARQAVRNRYGF